MRVVVRTLGSISVLTAIVLGACGSPDATKAREATVATAADQRLSGAQLEHWLLTAKTVPSRTTADFLVSQWINYVLFIERTRSGHSLEDSVATDSVIAADALAGLARRYFQDRDQHRAKVTDAQADSLFDVDRVRVFQQVEYKVPRGADSATMVGIYQRLQALVPKAREGDFTALVKAESQDSLSRAHDGFMPAISRDEIERFPPRVRNSIWILRPGDISAPFGAGAGFHLFRRATRVESREMLKAWLQPVLNQRADSLFVDSLGQSKHVKLASNAARRLRLLSKEPVVVTDTSAFATWDGGELTPAYVRSTLLQMTAVVRTQFSNASDAACAAFLKQLATRRILITTVVTEPAPGAVARSVLVPQYRKALGLIRDELSHFSNDLAPGEMASRLIDSALTGARHDLLMPGSLSEVLRNGKSIQVDSSAELTVLRLATPMWQRSHVVDSTAEQNQPGADSTATDSSFTAPPPPASALPGAAGSNPAPGARKP